VESRADWGGRRTEASQCRCAWSRRGGGEEELPYYGRARPDVDARGQRSVDHCHRIRFPLLRIGNFDADEFLIHCVDG